MVGKGKGEEVAVRAGRVFTDAAPLLLGSADYMTRRDLNTMIMRYPSSRQKLLPRVSQSTFEGAAVHSTHRHHH